MEGGFEGDMQQLIIVETGEIMDYNRGGPRIFRSDASST